MQIKNWKKEIFTIPNVLSMIRLALIPLYIYIYLNAKTDAHYYISAGILAVSCLTDLIDGQIARRCNMISTLGKMLDPFADKATQFTLIICLAVRNPVIWMLVILFVIKEGFQLIAGLLTLRKGKMLSGALISGKICTAVLFVSLIVLVMFPQIPAEAVNVIMAVDTLLLMIAFLHYAITYFTHGTMIQELDPKENEENA